MNKYFLNDKIANSKFSKNVLYYLIAPVVLLITGIILLFTVGFNTGIDFNGGSTFKLYVNNDNAFESVESYDLNIKEDYNEVYGKIEIVLAQGNLKIVSYQTGIMDIPEENVYGGQAVIVVFENTSNDQEKITAENDALRNKLLAEFGYNDHQSAVSTIDKFAPTYNFDWAIGLLAGIIFACLLALIYLAVRYHISAIGVGIMQMFIDLFLTLALVLICRTKFNLSIGITLSTILFISLFNLFVFYNKAKENAKTGKFEKMSNCEKADITTKQLFTKRTVVYLLLILICLIFIILGVPGTRAVALNILLGLIATYYSSTFITPAVWAIGYREKRKKREKIARK